jgi:hypothetical protein
MDRLKAHIERASRDVQNGNAGPRSPPRELPTTTSVVVLRHEPQEETPAPTYEWDPPEAMQRILAGDEIVVSHPGASQYTAPGGGVSACGIAALNCLHIIFGKERNGLRGSALVENIMTRDVAEVRRSASEPSAVHRCLSRRSPRYVRSGPADPTWRSKTSTVSPSSRDL